MSFTQIIEHYRENPADFIEDCLHTTLTTQQLEVVRAYELDERYIACKAGHGVGKSTVVAALIWHFLCCYHKPQIPITAPSSAQLFDALWSRISELYQKLDPIFKQNFVITANRIYHKQYKNEWFAVARTSKKENPDSMQGFHAVNLMYIVDEASGVPSDVFDVIGGSLTQTNNKMIMIGNPVRISGYFYDAFTKHSEQYHTITMNSEDSPLVAQEYIDSMARYGTDSNKYRVRVLGKFPKSEDDTLINLDYIENAILRNVSPSGDIVWGLDPARFGSDSTVLVKRQGRKVTQIKSFDDYDTMSIVGIVTHDYLRTAQEERPDRVCVDVIGLGAGVYDRMKEVGTCPAVAVNVAEKSNYPKEYKNQRAECYDRMREWFFKNNVDVPDAKGLKSQTSTITYKFASNGSMQIVEKDKYKKDNPTIGSPDIADAMMLTFYQKISVPLGILFV